MGSQKNQMNPTTKGYMILIIGTKKNRVQVYSTLMQTLSHGRRCTAVWDKEDDRYICMWQIAHGVTQNGSSTLKPFYPFQTVLPFPNSSTFSKEFYPVELVIPCPNCLPCPNSSTLPKHVYHISKQFFGLPGQRLCILPAHHRPAISLLH